MTRPGSVMIMRKMLTLALVRDGDRVLLGMKKRGFGVGRWNGFGGKLEPGEPVDRAAVREMEEECGVRMTAAERVGILEFTFPDDPTVLEVHVFRADRWEGEPRETEEMLPRWFPIDALPYDDMWPDDRHWLPLLLAGERFTGAFSFDAQGAIREMTLDAVPAAA